MRVRFVATLADFPHNPPDTATLKLLLSILIIGLPFAEIATFIKVGSIIGVWPTLLAIVATALIGAVIVRRQGTTILAQAQVALDARRLPVDSVIHGLFLLIAGILLLIPGFLTDAVGFLLLVPPVRMIIARRLLNLVRRSDSVHFYRLDMGRYSAKTTGGSDNRGQFGPIIEGEVVEEDAGSDGDDAEKDPGRLPPHG